MDTTATVWVASMGTRNTNSLAFGATAQDALKALVGAWIEKYCSVTESADPAYPWEIKEDIILSEGKMGDGYVLGPHDLAWYGNSMNAGHSSMESTWDALAERHGIAASPSP